jgi:integrase
MKLQRFSKSTQKNYLLAVKGLARYYNQSPETLSQDQIQAYILYLTEERKLTWGSVNNIFSGILCFCRHILLWDETTFKMPPRPRIKKIPSVLSEEEVKRLFDATTNLKHRVLLKTAYSAGLRISEVIRLRPEHIESDPSRMMIRVEQSKGRKDRYTVLSRTLLLELREYWRRYQPREWLFPGRGGKEHISSSSAHQIFMQAKKKPVSPGGGESTSSGIRLPPICSTMVPTSTPSNGFLAIHP